MRLRSAPILVAALFAFRPVTASACIWNPLHGFSPMPPCETEDIPVINRVNQVNNNLAAKLAVVALKVREVKSEIRAWDRAYDRAARFEDDLSRIYGDLTANPLPAMAAEYNRTAPMGRFVQLSATGDLVFTESPFDIKALGDSLLNAFVDDASKMASGWRRSPSRMQETVMRGGTSLQREFRDLREFQRATEIFRDSLQATGNRVASRYEGVDVPDGKAEADLSYLSAVLSRMRGGAYDAQVRSIQMRLQGVTSATAKRNQMIRSSSTLGSLRGW